MGTRGSNPGPNHRYSDRPFIAIWEATRACDLACVHCRASAESKPYPGELDTPQALDLIRQIAEWKVPLFVMTGGDPLKRGDILAARSGNARSADMTFALAPSVTPLLTFEKLRELQRAGLNEFPFPLDGADPLTHDTFRGIPGTFVRCMETMQWLKDLGLKLQVNTTVSRHNQHQMWEIARDIRDFAIERWSVFFLVPTGRAEKNQALERGRFGRSFKPTLRHLEGRLVRHQNHRSPPLSQDHSAKIRGQAGGSGGSLESRRGTRTDPSCLGRE